MKTIALRAASATLLVLAAQLSVSAAEKPAASAAASRHKHIMVAPDDIQWGECPPFLPPGGKCAVIEGNPQASGALFTFRSKLPDNYKIPPHFHLSNEHITVISGTFAMGLGRTFDENALRPMSVGSFMVMPRKVAHFALTHGETIVQVHAIGPMTFTYVDPKDDPRKR
jgi:anti-sigma factor ChrR (cupin superfamily)